MPSVNRVKQAIREGRVARGFSMNFPSPHVIEILGPLGFDFVWLDGEHGPFSPADLEEHCRAAELSGITPIARVPDIRSSTILQFLDRGIQGILGPHIATQSDAEQLVRACYFGPEGERSFGGNRGCEYDYELTDKAAWYRETNENMVVGALLEDAGVVDNLDEILSVDGIDYFSVGPNDFAQGLGRPGEADHPDVQAAIEDVYQRIRAAGRNVGSDVTERLEVKEALVAAGQDFLKIQQHRAE